jgi:hypothetical protein
MYRDGGNFVLCKQAMLALDDTRPIQYEGGRYKDVPTYIMGDGRGSISDFVCLKLYMAPVHETGGYRFDSCHV